MQTILPVSALSRWLTRGRGWVEPEPLGRSYELPGQKVLTLSFPAGGRIFCSGGCLWITCGGKRDDIVLTSGRGHEFSRGDRLLIEALEPSVFEIAGCRG